MAIRLGILGIDPIQREWLDAAAALAASGEIEVVGVGHRTAALAKDTADCFTSIDIPAFDDLRLFLKNAAPQVLLLDRPANASVDFLVACVNAGIGLLSLGPPVENFAEARAMSESLEPRSHLLYIWPRFADSPAYRRCTQADEFVRPIKFAAATWLGMNHVLAKTARRSAGPAECGSGGGGAFPEMPVRSLSMLAWDALATLIELIGLPVSVYAAVRGTIGARDTFVDISGAASLSLRFAEDAAASVTLSDRMPPPGRRDLLLLGQGGSVTISGESYDFRDVEGKPIDSSGMEELPSLHSVAGATALETLREYLRHYQMPTSPHRGWIHRLDEIAATMEAMIVSHRTGQAESPERFRQLRR